MFVIARNFRPKFIWFTFQCTGCSKTTSFSVVDFYCIQVCSTSFTINKFSESNVICIIFRSCQLYGAKVQKFDKNHINTGKIAAHIKTMFRKQYVWMLANMHKWGQLLFLFFTQAAKCSCKETNTKLESYCTPHLTQALCILHFLYEEPCTQTSQVHFTLLLFQVVLVIHRHTESYLH